MNILKTKGLRWGSFLLLSLILSYVNVLQAVPSPEIGEIVGRVENQHGAPEAGVWVIAETQEGLDVPYRKIVVTNDQGYFVIPELPKLKTDDEHILDHPAHEHNADHDVATYDVWVKGYGIKDSHHIHAKQKLGINPGDPSALKFKVHRYDGYDPNDPENNDNMSAADALEDAGGYPANYWLSMYQPPSQADLYPEPYVAPSRKTSTIYYGFGEEKPSPQWFAGRILKGQCMYCHQVGQRWQRFTSTKEQWEDASGRPNVEPPEIFDYQVGHPNYLACEDFVDPDPDWYGFLPHSSPHNNPWVIYVKKVEYTEVGDKLEYAIYDFNTATFIEQEIGTLIPTCGVSIDDLPIPLDLNDPVLKKCILDVANIRGQLATLQDGSYTPPNPYRLLPTAIGQEGLYLYRFNGEVYAALVAYQGNPLHIHMNLTDHDDDGVLQTITWPAQCSVGQEVVSTTFSDAVQSLLAKSLYAYFLELQGPIHAPLIDSTASTLGVDREKAIDLLIGDFLEWGQKVRSGEYPAEIPPRPKGKERNVVITQWDTFVETPWLISVLHDVVSTEKQNPANPIYRNGKVWGVDTALGNVLELDPLNHTVSTIHIPYERPIPYLAPTVEPMVNEWSYASPHNPMLDNEGNLWITTAYRPMPPLGGTFPLYATQGPFQTYMYNMGVILDPSGEAGLGPRQLVKFDLETRQFEKINTGYDTHHLHFDSQGVLWMSGDWRAVGTFYNPGNAGDTVIPFGPLYHGFTPPLVVGDQEYAYEFHYGIIPNDHDIATPASPSNPMLSVLTTTPYDLFGGGITRFVPHRIPDPNNPSRLIPTGFGLLPDGSSFGPISFYPVWWPGYFYNGTLEYFRYGQGNVPRGIDVTVDKDSSGNITGTRVFTAFAGTGEIAEFNRSQAAGTVSVRGLGPDHPVKIDSAFSTEGWTVWPTLGPRMGVKKEGEDTNQTTDFYYYVWVDQADTLGFGKNMVVVPGSNSDSLIVFDPYVDNPNYNHEEPEANTSPKGDVIAQIRIPYPMGFYSRGLDGRIDKPVCTEPGETDCYDPITEAGEAWKGKGWWTPYSFPLQIREAGKLVDRYSPIVKIQLRDSPLDR